jgi:hypothetical protein
VLRLIPHSRIRVGSFHPSQKVELCDAELFDPPNTNRVASFPPSGEVKIAIALFDPTIIGLEWQASAQVEALTPIIGLELQASAQQGNLLKFLMHCLIHPLND